LKTLPNGLLVMVVPVMLILSLIFGRFEKLDLGDGKENEELKDQQCFVVDHGFEDLG
jgi:hypothetical protein